MSIQILVPLEALRLPPVAQAVHELVSRLEVHMTLTVEGGQGAPILPASPKPTPVDDPLQERWLRYLDGLPAPSRRFLALLESKGRLTVDEAVVALGLHSSKAMGGLTGALVRWAPSHGIKLPFEARQTSHGVRYWVWTGVPTEPLGRAMAVDR